MGAAGPRVDAYVTPIHDLIVVVASGDEAPREGPDLGELEEADGELHALALAMTNPVRTAILAELARQPGQGAAELAEATGEPGSAVRRHLRVLFDAGLVQVVREESRRGAVKRFYEPGRTPPRIGPDEEARLPQATRVRIAVRILREIMDAARHALEEGTFLARPARLLARVFATVDEQGWRELAEIQAHALAEAERVCAESARRVEEKGGDRLVVALAVLLFERPIDDKKG